MDTRAIALPAIETIGDPTFRSPTHQGKVPQSCYRSPAKKGDRINQLAGLAAEALIPSFKTA